ncbi:MAG: Type secretion system protein [Acidobacteriota bacterium]|nr:Type secretion system protein [Acidobacteriota bacterium]
MKSEGKGQKAEGKNSGRVTAWLSSSFLPLRFFKTLPCALVLCILAAASGASAQKKPKPALSAKEARRVIATARGFGLKTGAVKIIDVSAAGSEPIIVKAQVTEAFHLVRVEDERVPQTGGFFKQKHWRAVEFRTGDRAWDEFDMFDAPAAAALSVEAARRALEELVTEFEAQQVVSKDKEKNDGEVNDGVDKGQAKKKEKDDKKSAKPLTRGPLTIKQLSLMGSSAVAEVVVEAAFSLSKDERGRWQVAEIDFGGGKVTDLESLWHSVNSRKAERARADLAALVEALDAFRHERGFYVEARDSATLVDHLSPRYTKRIIRIDPWHNPYRYVGTPASYTLGSDGPDGKQGTADDVTLSSSFPKSRQ